MPARRICPASLPHRASPSRRRMRRVPALILLAASGMLAAPSARAETLEAALADAYNDNPQLQAERANLRATDEGVNQALSGWRPTVQLNAAAGRERFEATPATATLAAHGLTDPRSAGVTLIQPLYQGGQTVAKTAQAENTVKAERAHLVAHHVEIGADDAEQNGTLDQTRAQFSSGLGHV